MNIRYKLLLGLSIIGFVLLLLGTVSIVQVIRFRHFSECSKTFKKMAACQQLCTMTFSINEEIANQVIEKSTPHPIMTSPDSQLFTEQINLATGSVLGANGLLDLLRKNAIQPQVYDAADSLYYSFEVFRSNIYVLDSLFSLPQTNRVFWHKHLYQKSEQQFINSIGALTEAHSEAASLRSLQLEQNLFRIIIALFSLLLTGSALIILFYYYIRKQV